MDQSALRQHYVCIAIFALTCAVNCSSISLIASLQQNNVVETPQSPEIAEFNEELKDTLTVNIFPTNYNDKTNPFNDQPKGSLVVPESSYSLLSNVGNMKSDERIVGGVETTPNEFPWQAFISTTFTSGKGSNCGGTLISEQWILTAASCVVPLSGDKIATISVLLGAHNRLQNEINQKTYLGKRIVYRIDWNSVTFNADLALIELYISVNYTQYIRPIPLANFYESSHVNDMVTLSGWGHVSESSITLSSTLRKVIVPVISNSDCKTFYGSSVTNGIICSSGTNYKGACNGDGGGPMIFQQNDGSWIQIGISSFGSSLGCDSGYPSGYTRISSYILWIESTVGQTLSPPTTTTTSTTMISYGRSSETSAYVLLTTLAIGFILIFN